MGCRAVNAARAATSSPVSHVEPADALTPSNQQRGLSLRLANPRVKTSERGETQAKGRQVQARAANGTTGEQINHARYLRCRAKFANSDAEPTSKLASFSCRGMMACHFGIYRRRKSTVTRITTLRAFDLRFPTSAFLDGSDASHLRPYTIPQGSTRTKFSALFGMSIWGV
jgi:hypothetical protein